MTDSLLLLLRAGALVVGLVLVLGTPLSALRTVVVPRAQNTRLTRLVFITTRRAFDLIAVLTRSTRAHGYDRLDALMMLYAPTALLMLPVAWISVVLLGFTLVYWAIGVETLELAFLLSGSAVLTLGSTAAPTLLTAALAYVEALIGLILIALLISYLPTMYAAFARREREVALLEVRAGTPPSALTTFERIHRLGRWDVLHDLWVGWELWFTDVEESHTSLAALPFFRSPQSDHHWVVAAGTLLDAAALAASTLDIPRDVQADLCIRSGYLALRRIAAFFRLPFDDNPRPTDPISISRHEFDAACDELALFGIPIKPDRDQCWRDFTGWRVNYDAPLLALAQLTLAPDAPTWTGRLGPGDAAIFGQTFDGGTPMVDGHAATIVEVEAARSERADRHKANRRPSQPEASAPAAPEEPQEMRSGR